MIVLYVFKNNNERNSVLLEKVTRFHNLYPESPRPFMANYGFQWPFSKIQNKKPGNFWQKIESTKCLKKSFDVINIKFPTRMAFFLYSFSIIYVFSYLEF